MLSDMADQIEEGGIGRSRRSVLASGGLVLAAAVGVPIGSADEHEDAFTEEEILALFELVIEDQGVEVAELEVEEEEALGMDVLSFDYYPLGPTEDEIIEEMGYVTGAFAEAVNMGLEVERLEATALDIAGEPISEWYVETEWAEEYNAGEMTSNELALETMMTLEMIDQ